MVRHIFGVDSADGFFLLEVVPLATDSLFLFLDEVDSCSNTLATEMKCTVFEILFCVFK